MTLKHVFHNPRFGFGDPGAAAAAASSLSAEEAERLVAICQDRLLSCRDPPMETLRLQAAFRGRYRPHAESVRAHRREVERRAAPLAREICEWGAAAGARRGDREALRAKVVACAVLRSGLGSPADAAVAREAGAALETVFSQVGKAASG